MTDSSDRPNRPEIAYGGFSNRCAACEFGGTVQRSPGSALTCARFQAHDRTTRPPLFVAERKDALAAPRARRRGLLPDGEQINVLPGTAVVVEVIFLAVTVAVGLLRGAIAFQRFFPPFCSAGKVVVEFDKESRRAADTA